MTCSCAFELLYLASRPPSACFIPTFNHFVSPSSVLLSYFHGSRFCFDSASPALISLLQYCVCLLVGFSMFVNAFRHAFVSFRNNLSAFITRLAQYVFVQHHSRCTLPLLMTTHAFCAYVCFLCSCVLSAPQHTLYRYDPMHVMGKKLIQSSLKAHSSTEKSAQKTESSTK